MNTNHWRAVPLTHAASVALNPYAVRFLTRRGRAKMYAWCADAKAADKAQKAARERYDGAFIIDRRTGHEVEIDINGEVYDAA